MLNKKERNAVLRQFKRLGVDQALKAEDKIQSNSLAKAIDEISRWTKLNIKALTFYANEHNEQIPSEIKNSAVYQELFKNTMID